MVWGGLCLVWVDDFRPFVLGYVLEVSNDSGSSVSTLRIGPISIHCSLRTPPPASQHPRIELAFHTICNVLPNHRDMHESMSRIPNRQCQIPMLRMFRDEKRSIRGICTPVSRTPQPSHNNLRYSPAHQQILAKQNSRSASCGIQSLKNPLIPSSLTSGICLLAKGTDFHSPALRSSRTKLQ